MGSEIEAAVRRELGRQGRRLAAIGALLVLVLTVVATAREEPPAGVEAGVGAGIGNSPATSKFRSSASAGGAAGASADADSVTGSASTAGGGSGSTSGAPGGGAAASATASEGGGSGAASGLSSGVSRTGVRCDGANRQLPESAYGPRCVGKFTGDNGGATSHGVTTDQIIVTYRIADSGEMGALQALGGSALDSVGLNQQGIAKDMQVLVDYFNKRFELYGRRVKFVPYKGQGDILQEYQGKGQQGAQADAARAKDLGAFADVSYAGQSQPYTEGLTSNGIVAFSPIYLSRSFAEAHAPLVHSAMWPAGEDGASFQANVVCGALYPGKAERSNDPVMRTRDRKFGIINAENPEYAKIGKLLEDRVKECGAPVVRRVAYALDVTRAAQTAANAVAQMQAAGATTVLCVCDFLAPKLFMEQSDKQGYVPEWFLTFHWSDPFYRTYPEHQFRGQLVGGGLTERYLETEPGKVFHAAGGRQPASPFTLDKVYQQIMLLFSGLQAAGPNLTPTTMFRGLEQVPNTLQGAVGPWEFGPGPSMPRRWFALGVYDPNATSNLDGNKGSSVGCMEGKYFRFDDRNAFRGSLSCPL